MHVAQVDDETIGVARTVVCEHRRGEVTQACRVCGRMWPCRAYRDAANLVEKIPSREPEGKW